MMCSILSTASGKESLSAASLTSSGVPISGQIVSSELKKNHAKLDTSENIWTEIKTSSDWGQLVTCLH